MNGYTLLPAFLMSRYSGELGSYRVVLFWGLAEFAPCLPRRALGQGPWSVLGSLGSWGWTPEQWGSGPLPRAARGGFSLTSGPPWSTSCANILCIIPARDLITTPVCLCLWLGHTRKWEYLASTRCAPQGMSAMFHLLPGTAKARDGGERWMGIGFCCKANHSRHREPSGAGALQHLCSFCIPATMEPPGRAQRSCCSCVLEWPPTVRSDLECQWAKSHPVMLTLMKRRRSRNRTG